jgi:flagellar hook-associated protein 2
VKSYNDLNKTLTDYTKYNAETKQASMLTGEATIRSMQTQLRSVFNKALSTAGGGVTSLSQIGITFQTDGTLKLDQTKLTAALKDPTKDISTLFAAVGKPTDALIGFTSSTADTKNGSYDVNVTQVAAQGKAVGSAPAALTITAGSNDALNVLVDGVAATVTLAAGNYTADTLAAEIQAKVNGASALSTAGIKVAVTQSGGALTMTSARYGATSNVSIPSGSALASVFGTPVETAGVDVAGTIGGVAATGVGQTLTGLGDATGLALKVNGGATGARGTIGFARGYAYELNRVANDMLGDHSEIDSRVNGIKTTNKDLEDQHTDMTARLSTVEARLRAQYSALDTMMSKMQSTSSFLTQQLASLPTISRS